MSARASSESWICVMTIPIHHNNEDARGAVPNFAEAMQMVQIERRKSSKADASASASLTGEAEAIGDSIAGLVSDRVGHPGSTRSHVFGRSGRRVYGCLMLRLG